MSIRDAITSAVLALSVASGSIVSLSSAANADGWRHHGGNHNAYSQRINPWSGGHRNPSAYEYRHDDGGYGYRRHHNNAGAAVAVGVFAAVLGLALAAESNRVQHQYYEDQE